MMNNRFCKFASAILIVLGMVMLCCFPSYATTTNSCGESSDSNAYAEVENISIGSKDKMGRYTVKITVKVKGVASNEYVKTIGVKWGTSKFNQDHRDTRSNANSVTFTSAWHSGSTYYVTPVLKTNLSDSEMTGATVTSKTP